MKITPIKGSLLYRRFCEDCGEPMRVTFDVAQDESPVYCERCSRHLPTQRGMVITPRQGHGLGRTSS